ncbi:MAG: glycosyltransferase family 2 protein [Candidatus Methylomirabilales bacterium]
MSIVICTKDRPADLACAIASIRGCGDAGRRAEIIVVEEADGPREIPGVRYVHLPREGRGFGYARNVGVQAAGGDLVLFLDDDCEAEQGWVEALTAPLRSDARVLGAAGAVMVRDYGRIGYAENILGFPGGGLRYLDQARGQLVPTRYLSTCNCAYRKEALLQVGGFLEDARLGGEDFLLAERVTALGPCVYAPTAVVYHRPRGRLSGVFRWFVRRGQSEIGLLRTTTDRGRFARALLRSSWTLRALVVAALLAWWPRLALLLPAVGIVYYGAILWRFKFARAYASHRRAWWVVPIVKLTMDLGTEVGRWKALVLESPG